jgi:hypothetical protein
MQGSAGMRRAARGAPARGAPAARGARPAARPAPCRAAAVAGAAAPLPTEVWEMTAQVGEAVKAAAAVGSRRHAVQVINPVNEKAVNFSSTEAMDYPCS